MVFEIEDFVRTYKGSRNFVETSKYFETFISDLSNEELQRNIKFCNDVLCVPPVEAYVKYRSDIFCEEMTKSEKQGIGACFGYLYQYGKYASEYGSGSAVRKWVGHDTTGIKNASYFAKK